MSEFDLVFRDLTRKRDPVLRRALVVRALRAASGALRVPRGITAEIAVTVVGPRRMRSLNRKWRKVDNPTDVLAFPLHPRTPKGYTSVSLGDIFICPDVVRLKARQAGNPYSGQAKWSLVHGILHLAGYDHEKSTAAAKRMEAQERKILRSLK
ncbi:MAG TPA: rRNA maturation RNase YbeY [Candidatus Paceibacterota bacterium]|nr:rRNA maturation RNase YbeY [Candidatus Paceibacterota bacterium]